MRTVRLFSLLSGIVLFGCNSSQTSTSANSPSTNAASPSFSNVTTVKQLMGWIIDPNAAKVWAAVGSVVTPEGEQKLAPKTDEEWVAVRNAAATVAETGNLLMLAGRARDQADWMSMTRAMIDKANESLQAAEAKDVEAMFTSGGDLYLACTACHAKYLIGEPLKDSGPTK
jgi:hypothetical protein